MAIRQDAVPVTDSVLVARVTAGDENALGLLYDRHGATAYALAYAITRSAPDAEEAVADAFAQLWRTAASFDATRGNVAAWLTTITRSRALDRVRSRQRQRQAVERASAAEEEGVALPVSSPGGDPSVQAEQEEKRLLVGRSLEELPEAQRKVIELAYFGGLSQSEIAEELHEPLGTVKTRMRAGMQKLRQALAPLFGEVGS